MQKLPFALLTLLLSIAGTLCAQKKDYPPNGEQLFEPPAYSFTINYDIRLGNGNRLRIQLANGYDIRDFRNIDSVLTAFLDDMKAFHDSLTDPLTVKHIDYLIDATGKKKLSIRQNHPAAATFLLDGQGPAVLRTQQDTVNILVVTPAGTYPGRTIDGLRYDRLGFFVNHYSELETLDLGSLKNEIITIISHQTIKPGAFNRPTNYEVNDSIIKTETLERKDQLEISASAAVENYKNYFTPSAIVRAVAVLHRGRNDYLLGLSWEPLFFFSTDANGHLQTYRNDLVVLNYEHNHLDAHDHPNPAFGLDPAFSIGYVFRRQGDYFTQPSFRFTFGAGKLGPLRLEPALFFNNFFKDVTPGLRLNVGAF
jgi:hypothetical protein